MSRRPIDDDRAPWSFFIPMTLAVACGVLIADGVRHAVVVVFGDRAVADGSAVSREAGATVPASVPDAVGPPSAPVATASQPVGDASTVAAATATPAGPADGATPASAADATAATAVDAATPAAPAAAEAARESGQAIASDGIEQLPGTVSARRDALPRACINGSVAVRDRNGWQQELSSDRPVRCEQTGP